MSLTDSLSSVLSAASELNLPEGHYLTIANALKQVSDENTEYKVQARAHIGSKTTFLIKKSRYVIEIKEEIAYIGPKANDYNCIINGVQKFLAYSDVAAIAARIIYRFSPKILLETDGISVETTFKEFAENHVNANAYERRCKCDECKDENNRVCLADYPRCVVVGALLGIEDI